MRTTPQTGHNSSPGPRPTGPIISYLKSRTKGPESELHGVKRAVDSNRETGPAFSRFWGHPWSCMLETSPFSSHLDSLLPLSCLVNILTQSGGITVTSPQKSAMYVAHLLFSRLLSLYCPHPSCWLLSLLTQSPSTAMPLLLNLSLACERNIFVIFSLAYFAQHFQLYACF